MSEQNEKEVIMDVKEGGRRSRKGRRRGQTKKSGRGEEEFDDTNDKTPYVTKEEAVKPNTVLKPGPPVVTLAHAKTQSGGSSQEKQATQPKVVLAPAKQKPAKVMLVPKRSVTSVHRLIQKKTFKAKRVAVTIDNTAKTQKQRKAAIAQIDAMTEDQVRAAAVAARLSRRETVAKAPIGLLRQMVKDYRSLRGLL